MILSLCGFVGLLAATSTNTASAASATNASTLNFFAGTWSLTELTLKSPNGTVSQPAGDKPYGRLVLTPGFFFVSQFNSGNYSSQPFSPFPQLYTPGTNANNAAVVRNTLALSGTYSVDEQGDYLGLTTTGSTIPNFINSSVKPPNSTFQLTEGGHGLIETLTTDGSVVEYHWTRVEVL